MPFSKDVPLEPLLRIAMFPPPLQKDRKRNFSKINLKLKELKQQEKGGRMEEKKYTEGAVLV